MFEKPQIIISAFELENILTASTVADARAGQRALAAINKGTVTYNGNVLQSGNVISFVD